MKVADQWLRDVLLVLYRRRSATRGEIIEDTGLNPASVSLALRHLLRHGVVERVGETRSTGGRRREVLKLNPEVGYFLAVDLEGMRLRFALTAFTGEIRYRWEELIVVGQRLEFQRVQEGIQRLLDRLSWEERRRVLAVGVSYTGLLDEAGRVTAVNLGWSDFPFREMLEATVDFPVFFGVDGFCKLLAERWLGAAENSDNCLYVMLGLGIGVGACVNGHFLRGCRGMAGEFGHITVDAAAPDRCACGKTGCLEATASSPNIVRQYLENAGRDPREVQICTLSQVFARAREKDPAAMAALARAGKYLGLALAHLVNVLNPEIVVLGGDLTEGWDLMAPLLEEQLAKHALPALRACVELRPGRLAHDAGLRGAAALAFQQALAHPALLKRMASPAVENTEVAARTRRGSAAR